MQAQMQHNPIPIKARGAHSRWSKMTPEQRSAIMTQYLLKYWKEHPRFTQEQIERMNVMAETMTYAKIAAHFGCHTQTVWNYLNRYPKIGKFVLPPRKKRHKWDRSYK